MRKFAVLSNECIQVLYPRYSLKVRTVTTEAIMGFPVLSTDRFFRRSDS